MLLTGTIAIFSRTFRYRPVILGVSSLKKNFVHRTCSSLSYKVYSEADERKEIKPLIILHGLFGSKTNWHSFAKKISATGRKVISVDARNHGESFHKDSMSYEEMSEDLVQLMSLLRINNAVVLGHSMGGKTAMITALTKPNLVSCLIVVDVAPTESPSAAVFPLYAHAMKAVHIDPDATLAETRRSIDQQLQATLPDLTLRQFILTNVVERNGAVKWRLNLDVIISDFGHIAGFQRYDNFYDGPTLFLGGSNSAYIRKSDEPEIHRLFPQAEIQYIKGAGHWIHAEKPQDFYIAVNRFLEKTGN